MARSRTEFAEFVATLSADDAELQKDLKSAEQTTRVSAERMQANLDKVAVSSQGAGVGLTDVAAGTSVASAAMGAMGPKAAKASSALARLASVLVSPTGVIIGLAAATIGVIAFNKAAAAMFNDLLVSLGLLDDLAAAQDRINASMAASEARLDKQVEIRAKLNAELEAAQLTRTAQRTGSPEVIAEQARLNALEVVQSALVAAGAGVAALDIAQQISEVHKDTAQSAKDQEDFAKTTLGFERDRVAELTKRKQIEEKLAALQATRLQAAQSLLVGIGAAEPSEFIGDPILKRLAQLSESLKTKAQGFTGAFGLRRIGGTGDALRAGQTLGSQQLSTAEKHKDISAKTLAVAEKVRELLSRIASGTTDANPSLSSPLLLSGNP